MSIPDHLAPSKLGTKEYWDNLYTTELSNNTADPSDIGTVWFDDSAAESKITSFLSTHPVLSKRDTSFIDLGCGNGSLLFSLRDYEDDGEEGGWTGRMLGIDYSPQSIALATQILSTRSDSISFAEWDLLNGPLTTPLSHPPQLFDCILDKGTFDAISLSPSLNVHGRRIVEGYKDRVLQLVRRGGYFLVTSCNWTEEELKAWFESGGEFEMDGRVEYKTFSFGGRKGQTITTLCFRKV